MEKNELLLLIYSQELDKVFYFCCKFFNNIYILDKLGNAEVEIEEILV